MDTTDECYRVPPAQLRATMDDDTTPGPVLRPDGLHVRGETLPLFAGSVHYFRLARPAWQPALESLRGLGVRFVDTAVPWSVHETSPGFFDFGHGNPRLDVVAFMELAARLGLRCIVRLGPQLDAQLAFDAIPERVVWDEACMARTRSGAPRVTVALPVAYPTPSHASRAFHDHAAKFLRAAAERLAPLARPGGPLALVILGDELRSGLVAPSGGDHHPDAIAQYRRFLKHRYRTLGALRRVHGEAAVFEQLEPPRDAVPYAPGELGAHLDWLEAQEAIVEGAFYRYRSVVDRHGLRGVAKIHEQADFRTVVPVDPARMERVASGVSFRCKASASEDGRREIAMGVTHAASRAAARGTPAFASRVNSGFPAGSRSSDDEEDLFVAMTALAYGARGLGLHAGVQRDRWIGGPVDPRGRSTPCAERWRRLFAGLERTRHWELTREAIVHVAVPRSLERLLTLCSPLAPLAPDLLGASGSLEGEADPTRGALGEALDFSSTLERVLDAERVPYAFVPAEHIERSLGGASWTIVVCPSALDPGLTASIAQHALMGKPISVGPRPPARDATFVQTSRRLPSICQTPVPLVLPRGPATLSELVRVTLRDLGVSALPAEPDFVRTTLHVDSSGRPRALFVVNPGTETADARVSVASAVSASDACSGEALRVDAGTVRLDVPARTVRLLALAGAL